MDWQATVDGPQFTSSPSTGTTPSEIMITVGNFDPQTPSTYSGAVMVTVTDPPAVSGSPHVINLTLSVVETSIQQLFLPMLNN
jgi:hypothetical protein